MDVAYLTQIMPLIDKAAQRLIELGATEVYLFGSAATGRWREHSDIDLAVRGLPPNVFFRAMGDVCDILHRQVDMVDLDEDTPFTRYLSRKGVLHRVG